MVRCAAVGLSFRRPQRDALISRIPGRQGVACLPGLAPGPSRDQSRSLNAWPCRPSLLLVGCRRTRRAVPARASPPRTRWASWAGEGRRSGRTPRHRTRRTAQHESWSFPGPSSTAELLAAATATAYRCDLERGWAGGIDDASENSWYAWARDVAIRFGLLARGYGPPARADRRAAAADRRIHLAGPSGRDCTRVALAGRASVLHGSAVVLQNTFKQFQWHVVGAGEMSMIRPRN